MRKINLIIIHCAATRPQLDIGADVIRRWHVQDNGWTDIAYHKVIRRNGQVEDGRPLEQAGAHCSGHNAASIGICLVGGLDESGRPANNFTLAQWEALKKLVVGLKRDFPEARVAGHREFAAKDCPCFDVPAWWAGIAGH